jgi:hypothetical protein
MWNESMDVLDLVRTSRERAEHSRVLAKQMAAATESTVAMILSSRAAISECDRFICKNWNYFPRPVWSQPEAAGETDSGA